MFGIEHWPYLADLFVLKFAFNVIIVGKQNLHYKLLQIYVGIRTFCIFQVKGLVEH